MDVMVIRMADGKTYHIRGRFAIDLAPIAEAEEQDDGTLRYSDSRCVDLKVRIEKPRHVAWLVEEERE